MQLTDGFVIMSEEEEDKGSYVIRKLNVKQKDHENHVTMYHFTAWPDKGVPKKFAEFVEFVEASRAHGKQSTKDDDDPDPRIIVHCSAGTGRTACYIILY